MKRERENMRERERGRECKTRWSNERGPKRQTDIQINRRKYREWVRKRVQGEKEADRRKCERANRIERERGRECKTRWSNEIEGTRDRHTDRQKEIKRVGERQGLGEKEADRRKCERGVMKETERSRQNVK
jgi:hypothetical protein